jgi:hypothetical protein
MTPPKKKAATAYRKSMEPVEVIWKGGHQEEMDAHLLQGCAIEYDGPAKVDEYFKPTIKGKLKILYL